jgi:hypothetical protein
VAPSIRKKVGTNFAGSSVGIVRLRTKTIKFVFFYKDMKI